MTRGTRVTLGLLVAGVLAASPSACSARHDHDGPDGRPGPAPLVDGGTSPGPTYADAQVAPGPWPSDGAESGTRLALAFWEGLQAERVLRGALFDRTLARECIPARWTDGVVRCTPQTLSMRPLRQGSFDDRPTLLSEPPASSGLVVFTDPACTVPIALFPRRDADPATGYVMDVRPSTCDAVGPRRAHAELEVAHVYRAAAARSDDAVFVRGRGAECASLNLIDPSRPAPVTYDLGAEVPASTFATLTPVVTPSASPLRTSFHVSEDGAKLPSNPHATAFDDACYFRYVSGAATATCIPRTLASAGESPVTYGDDACTTPVAAIPAACPAPRGIWITGAAPGGLLAATFHLAGAAAPEAWVSEGAGCQPAVPGPVPQSFWRVGAAASLPTATRAHDSVAGRRLQLVHLTSGAFAARDTATLYDAELGVECALVRHDDADAGTGPTPIPTSDPVLCEPRACGAARLLFADAQCLTPVPVYAHTSSEPACASSAVPTYVGRRAVLGRLTGSFFEKVSPGPGVTECVPATPAAVDHALGAELPPDAFVRLTASHDP